VEVGRGALPASQIDEFLQGPSAAPAKLTAPASGLFLERVFYEGDEQSHPLVAAFPVADARR
jgi:tRNA pseudouridine38-40 synthase